MERDGTSLVSSTTTSDLSPQTLAARRHLGQGPIKPESTSYMTTSKNFMCYYTSCCRYQAPAAVPVPVPVGVG